jgi:hypothetical protein
MYPVSSYNKIPQAAQPSPVQRRHPLKNVAVNHLNHHQETPPGFDLASAVAGSLSLFVGWFCSKVANVLIGGALEEASNAYDNKLSSVTCRCGPLLRMAYTSPNFFQISLTLVLVKTYQRPKTRQTTCFGLCIQSRRSSINFSCRLSSSFAVDIPCHLLSVAVVAETWLYGDVAGSG